MEAKTKKKPIAFVYDTIFPYVMGGAERRYYEIGRRLAAQGHDVHLYGMKYWDGPNVIERDGLILHGICKARPLYTKSGRRKIGQAIIFGLAATKLLFVNFDVIDCGGFPYFSLFPAKVAALVRRKPLYVTWHEVWGLEYWRGYLGILGYAGALVERLASKLPNTFIAVSEKTADDLRHSLHCRQPIMVVENGIDVAEIDRVPGCNPAKYDVVYMGRLIEYKNIDLLLGAVARLKDKHRLSLLIVGDGPDRTRLERQVHDMALSELVTFVGMIPGNAVYGYVKSAKVFVLPSKREGFGITVLEANACGLPVVTVTSPDNAAAQLIDQGVNGFLAEPSASSIAESIQRALNERHTMNPRQRVELHDWTSVADKVARIIYP